MSETPTGPLIELPTAFTDERGTIAPLVEREMRSLLLITSREGAVRANHYHRADWHYCYVVSGVMEYHYRVHGSSDPPTRILVREGEMVFTPALVEHAMTFSEETTFITCGGGPRDQASYEADLVRVQLIDS